MTAILNQFSGGARQLVLVSGDPTAARSNSNAIREAMALGGAIEIKAPGTYAVLADNFDISSTAIVRCAPGVVFQIDGVTTPLATLPIVSQKFAAVRYSNVLTKSWAGRLNTKASGADYTCQTRTVLETPFHQVRIGILNSVTSSIENVQAMIGTAVNPGPADGSGSANNAVSQWTNLTFAESATVTLAAGTSLNVPSITWSDWVNAGVTRVRSDGGTLPVLVVRVQIPAAAANIPCWHYTDTTGWQVDDATTAPVGRFWRMREQNVLAATSASATNFTTTTAATQIVPVVIQYVPRNAQGITVMLLGDSTVEGTGGDLRNHGYDDVGRALVSTNDTPVELCNLAIAGAAFAATSFPDRTAWLDQITPEYLFCPVFSINNVSPPSMTSTDFDLMSLRRGPMEKDAGLYGARFVYATGLPVNASAEAYTNDQERVAFNNACIVRNQNGGIVFDAAQSVSAKTTLDSGQVEYAPGMTSDAVHPSTRGYTVLGYRFAGLLRQFQKNRQN
jgi:hypothetical protein